MFRSTCTQLLVLAVTLVQPAIALAQDPPATNDDAPATGLRAGRIIEIGPEIIYMQNEDDQWVPATNFSFEEWQRIWDAVRREQGADRPAFQLDEMTVSGQVEDDVGRLQIQFAVTLRDLEALDQRQWVRVPLRLPKVVLRQSPTFTGDGQYAVSLDQQTGELVAWIKASANTQHQLHVDVEVAVEQLAGEYRLALHTPQALVSSLDLEVPLESAEGSLTDLASKAVRKMKSEQQSDGSTRLTTAGIRGDLQLAWRSISQEPMTETSGWDVMGNIRVTVNGPHEMIADARLQIRSFGEPIDVIQVRLPPGMVLRPRSEPGYQTKLVNADTQEGQLVEIKVNATRVGVRELPVRLVCEMLPTQRPPASETDATDSGYDQPARFDVLGAIRQRGTIECEVVGNWSLTSVEGTDVIRSDEGFDTASGPNTTARFRYYSQPCSLQLAVRERRTGVRVEPRYLMTVSADRVGVDATFQYRFSGARPGPLAIYLNGWVVDQIFYNGEPPNLIPDVSQVDPLLINLPAEVSSVPSLEIRVLASRAVTATEVAGVEPLEVELPHPVPAPLSRSTLFVNAADVQITAEQNVELVPISDQIQGLVPRPRPPRTEPLTEVSSEFFYRDRGSLEAAIFTAQFRIRPLTLTVESAVQAKLESQRVAVHQSFGYRIAHGLIQDVDLQVPASLVQGDVVSAQFYFVRQPPPEDLAAEPLSDPLVASLLPAVAAPDEPQPETRTVRVSLPETFLRSFWLVGRYNVALPSRSDDTPVDLILPIMQPAASESAEMSIADSRVQIQSNDQMRVELAGTANTDWTRDDASTRANQLTLTSATHATELPLTVQLLPQRVSDATAIRQMWVQSWLTTNDRRDRVAMRMSTNDRQLRIQLPENVLAEKPEIVVTVNGHEHRDFAVTTRQLTLNLAADGAYDDLLVEIWYRFQDGRPAAGKLFLDAPSLVGGDRVQRVFWQVILPRQEHLLWSDSEVTADHSWRWKGWFWQREANLSQRGLEDWIGSEHQEPIPATANQYLFTAFRVPESLRVTTSDRSLILLVAGGIVLGGGLLLVYLPVVRHPGLLILVAVVLAGLAMAAPEPAMLFSQVAAFGLGLLLLSRLLQWALGRQTRSFHVRGRTYSTSDSQSLELPSARDGSSRVSTITSPATFSASATEPRP